MTDKPYKSDAARKSERLIRRLIWLNMTGLSLGVVVGAMVFYLISHPPILAIAATLGTWFIGGLFITRVRN